MSDAVSPDRRVNCSLWAPALDPLETGTVRRPPRQRIWLWTPCALRWLQGFAPFPNAKRIERPRNFRCVIVRDFVATRYRNTSPVAVATSSLALANRG